METSPNPPTRSDPDFHQPAEPRLIAIDHAPESYLRLVANPFLGFFGILCWLGVVVHLIRTTDNLNNPWIPPIVLGMVFALVQIPKLFHYHCLDCGATGRLSRWRQHLCPAASERRRLFTPRRVRGPSPPLQVLFWLWIILALAVLLIPKLFRP